MFENIFGIHEQALKVAGERLSVLAANLANVDTPGFKARDIDFAEVLSQAAAEADATGSAAAGAFPGMGGALPLAVTSAAHITMTPPGAIATDLKYRNPYQASLDGNTVEMPVEQAAFAENNVRYQASLNFINGRISELQLAIMGQ